MYEEAKQMYLVINDIKRIEECYAKLVEQTPDKALELYE